MSIEEDKNRKNFIEELGKDDVAIVFKNNGKLKLYLLDHSTETDEIKYNDSEILVLALGKMLSHKPFVDNLINTFFKIVEETNKRISELEEQRKTKESDI